MESLQEQVFTRTQALVGRFSWLKNLVFAVITAVIFLLFLLVISVPIGLEIGLLVFAVSLAYTVLIDFFMRRREKKTVSGLYAYLKNKQPDLELFIPLLRKAQRGFQPRKAALCFNHDQMYLEAFSPHRTHTHADDSMTVMPGKDFQLERYEIAPDQSVVTYYGRLLDTEYHFAMVYIPELVERVESYKGELA